MAHIDSLEEVPDYDMLDDMLDIREQLAQGDEHNSATTIGLLAVHFHT